jgi:hypothetical protein
MCESGSGKEKIGIRDDISYNDISESLVTLTFMDKCSRILEFFVAGPDPGWKKSDPG